MIRIQSLEFGVSGPRSGFIALIRVWRCGPEDPLSRDLGSLSLPKLTWSLKIQGRDAKARGANPFVTCRLTSLGGLSGVMCSAPSFGIGLVFGPPK